jgi:hypothetical protein
MAKSMFGLILTHAYITDIGNTVTYITVTVQTSTTTTAST